jgi:predicted nucleic acid-binding protein
MMPETIVITDTSVLINFLVLDEVGLLSRLPDRSFVVTDHVRAEITAHHSEQLQRLEQAFASGMLEEIRVTDLEEVRLFAKLTATGLGIGECSAIAVAAHRKLALAIDDKRAIKKLHKMSLGLTVLTTEMLVVLLIQHGILTVAEADAMKLEWEQNHRFRLTFQSFAERI